MASRLLSYKDPDPRRALYQWSELMDKETPRWIDGASVKRCTHCHDTSKKRHNCRLCGLLFCSMVGCTSQSSNCPSVWFNLVWCSRESVPPAISVLP